MTHFLQVLYLTLVVRVLRQMPANLKANLIVKPAETAAFLYYLTSEENGGDVLPRTSIPGCSAVRGYVAAEQALQRSSSEEVLNRSLHNVMKPAY
jgi:hypothetical protein